MAQRDAISRQARTCIRAESMAFDGVWGCRQRLHIDDDKEMKTLTDSNGKAAVHGKLTTNIDITGSDIYRVLGQVLPLNFLHLSFSWIFTPT